MNFRALCAVAALMASCLVSSLSASAAEIGPKRSTRLASDASEEARVIVQFKSGAGTVKSHALSPRADRAAVAATLQRRADALAHRRGVALAAGRGITERRQVVRATGMNAAALARLLAADPDVEYAEVEHRRWHTAVPNDPLFAPVPGSSPASGQWYLKAPDTTSPASINAVAAWDVTQATAGNVVAVLDTGVRYDHPDLAGKLLPGRDMVRSSISNDGDGRDNDASDPGDWISASDKQNSLFSDCDVADSSWHGTIVSGIVGAATDNGLGMAGVAWNAKILPVRVLGKCFGYDGDIQAGMLWAAGIAVPGEPANSTPAQVLNLSLGGDGTCSQAYQDTVNQIVAAGKVIVAAAGNSNGHAVETPGNCPGVIAVAGVRHAGTKVGYSDLGPEVTVAAPAGNCVNTGPNDPCEYPILSTTNAGTTTPVAGARGARYTDAFNYSVGTSFSAPQVAGAAALMLAANPGLTPAQVKRLLQAGARPFPVSGGSAGIAACHAPGTAEQDECYCTTSTCGAGLLDVGLAVKNASALANGLLAAITASSDNPTAGQMVTLSASQTQVGPGRAASYAWAVAGGDAAANFIGAVDGTSATLSVTGAGTVTVRLTVTDEVNNVSTVHKQITVAAAPASSSGNPGPVTSGSSSGGGGGGGALSWPWLLALALAVALLAAPRRRAQI